MSITEANDFLMSGGVPSAKFPNGQYGTTVSGTISQQPRVEQQTDPKDGKPKFWESDNKPMMQLIVTVQTEQRDPSIVDDDGQRAFYIKAKMQAAVRDAVRASGAKGLAVGGTLAITYVGDGEQSRGAFSPPKLYSATYTPPAAIAANQFLNQGAPAVPAQPQYAPPAAQPTYVPPAPAPVAPVAQAAPAAPFTPPPGMDPNVAAAIANLTPEQRAQMGLPA